MQTHYPSTIKPIEGTLHTLCNWIECHTHPLDSLFRIIFQDSGSKKLFYQRGWKKLRTEMGPFFLKGKLSILLSWNQKSGAIIPDYPLDCIVWLPDIDTTAKFGEKNHSKPKREGAVLSQNCQNGGVVLIITRESFFIKLSTLFLLS